MARRIPSLQSLLCFEYTARFQSVSRAAEELHLTQSAVSRQIKGLENFLNIALFIREKQRLRLSPEGKTYLHDLQPHLDGLETVTLKLMSSKTQSGVLNLAAQPTFSTKVLIPLLPEFKKHAPDIAINFISRIGKPDFEKEAVDVAILYGDGHWPDLTALPLCGEELIPLCHPDLLTSFSNPPVYADLKDQTLIHITTRLDAWPYWLEQVGANGIDSAAGPKFEHFTMAVQAAIAGLGIALLPSFVAEDEQKAGRLVQPFDARVISPKGYFIACDKNRSRIEKISYFMDWLNSMKEELPYSVSEK